MVTFSRTGTGAAGARGTADVGAVIRSRLWKINKIDYIDAGAITEAVARLTMRLMPIKTMTRWICSPCTEMECYPDILAASAIGFLT